MAWMQIKDDGNNFIESSVLIDFLSSQTLNSLIDLIKVNTNPDGYISFSALKLFGVNPSFDVASQNVNLEIQSKHFKSQKVYLSTKAHKRAADSIQSTKWSGYLNLRAKETYLETDITGTAQSTIQSARQAETNLRYKNIVLENNIQFDEAFNGENEYFREKSRLIFDFTNKQSRLTLGDLDPLPTGFQSLENGFGVSYTKAYSINPAYFNSVFRRSSLTLLEKSFVEVLVNGQLVDRFYAQPGVLDLLDFPFLNGSNNVEIGLVDSFGQRRKFLFDAAFDFRLLPKGLSEHSFQFEWLRDNTSSRQNDYDFNDWLMTSFYRIGLTKRIALGANIQARNQYTLLGSEGVLNIKNGILEWDLGLSSNTNVNDDGFAVKTNYQNFFSTGGKRTDVRYQLGVDHFSKGFSYYDSLVNRTDYEWSLSASVTQNYLSRISAGIGLSKLIAGSRGGIDRTELNSTFGFNVGRNFLFSMTTKANISDFNDYTAYFTLNWFEPVNFQQITSSYSPREEISSVLYTSQPIRGKNNLRLNTGIDRQTNISRATSGLEYQNQRVDAQLNGATNISDPDQVSLRSDVVSGSVGTALVFAGGQFAISRPIENSFAIVTLDQSIKKQKLPVNKFNSFQGAEINFLGPAVLNNLTPYFEQAVVLDSKSLPLGYALSKENFTIRPGFKAGELVKADLIGEVSIRGQFEFGSKNKSYINARIVSNTQVAYDFFSNEQGEFFISGVIPGVYKLTLDGYEVEYSFEITKKSIGIIDLGVVNVIQKLE